MTVEGKFERVDGTVQARSGAPGNAARGVEVAGAPRFADSQQLAAPLTARSCAEQGCTAGPSVCSVSAVRVDQRFFNDSIATRAGMRVSMSACLD
jgi:hypothetical protein